MQSRVRAGNGSDRSFTFFVDIIARFWEIVIIVILGYL